MLETFLSFIYSMVVNPANGEVKNGGVGGLEGIRVFCG